MTASTFFFWPGILHITGIVHNYRAANLPAIWAGGRLVGDGGAAQDLYC